MLKSKFSLQSGDEDEQLEEELPEHVEAAIIEETIIDPVRKLQKSEITIRLSVLGKTAEGDGYTYLKAACTGLQLTDITALKNFKHLQYIDVSNNNLDLESLQAVTCLPFLLLIQADRNIAHSAALNKTKYLQVMILNYNRLTSVHDVYQPELSTFEAGYNKISKVYFENRMPNLKCLDFRYNIITDIAGVNFPNLDSLYLAGNKIKSLVGLARLVNLRILHVRHNPIKLLDGFDSSLKKLLYVNLRNCKVATLKQVKKLRVLSGLETLILKGCPYMGGTGEENTKVAAEEEDAELRVEILAALPRLKRLNKNVVSPEERTEAKDLMVQWLEEGEKVEEEEEASGNED